MIRRAVPDDADVVRSVRLAALQDAPAAFTTTYADALALDAEVWSARLQPDAHPTFIWDEGGDGGGVEGMVVGVTDDLTPEQVRLVAMWVRPGARRRGVGAALVDHVLAWAAERSARQVALQVVEGNDAAERLYARCGFERTGLAVGSDGTVLIEMACRVPGP